MTFTAERIAHCQAAMSKPAPRQALAFLASGRATVEIDQAGYILIDTVDGQSLRDNGRKMGLSGAWPLLAAGMVDQSGCVTDAGRELLQEIGNEGTKL
ncbi:MULTISPECIES: hypothetical protein [unclassified Yoonia]|uniref:hypothetical protein n=1 Tax=unclassified Yoonia TaxID=2629118 RepID=UPI002AFDD62E|nr:MULTISPECIES: hypothetical protein [unclassified Yoonia]